MDDMNKNTDCIHSQKLEIVGGMTLCIVHDINNILTAIQCIAERIIADNKRDKVIIPDVRAILTCADKMSRLTDQALSFVRKRVPQKETVNVNNIINELMVICERLIWRRNIKLITRLDPGVKTILINSSQLEQILLNLIINARDAMPDGGIIRIETENVTENEYDYYSKIIDADTDYIKITISDNGCGMDEHTLANYIKSFFTTKDTGGTGIGMSIVKQLIKYNNGYLSCDSEKGKGTHFMILFPVVESTSFS